MFWSHDPVSRHFHVQSQANSPARKILSFQCRISRLGTDEAGRSLVGPKFLGSASIEPILRSSMGAMDISIAAIRPQTLEGEGLRNGSASATEFNAYPASIRARRSRASVAGSQDTYTMAGAPTSARREVVPAPSPTRGGSTTIEWFRCPVRFQKRGLRLHRSARGAVKVVGQR